MFLLIGLNVFLMLAILALWRKVWCDGHTQAALREENARLLKRAYEDPLTGLCTRQALFKTAQVQDNELYAIIDIDGFRSVNTRFGHDVGNQYLIKLATHLEQTCPEQTTISRIGKDRFSILLPRTPDAAFFQNLLQDIKELSITAKMQCISRTTSIGIADLTETETIAEAHLMAETALLQAKDKGGQQIKHADALVAANIRRSRETPTIEELRMSRENGDMEYFVQPIFNVRSGMVTGVEALMRWRDEGGTLRSPQNFTHLMHYADRLCVRPSDDIATQTLETFSTIHPQMFCSFNVSSAFMERPGEVDKAWLNNLLERTPPHQIVLELVESAVIANPAKAARMMADLRERGIRVALDDFGTGESNLNRLREYPVDIVKLDRQFIMNLEEGSRDMGILMGLIQMSESMGFDIIAEGVETAEQLTLIKNAGIDLAQGYYLGRPQPVETWQMKLLKDPTFTDLRGAVSGSA